MPLDVNDRHLTPELLRNKYLHGHLSYWNYSTMHHSSIESENIKQLKLASTGIQNLLFLNLDINKKLKQTNISLLQANLLNFLFNETYEALINWIYKYYDRQKFQDLTDYTPTGLQQLEEYKTLARLFGIFKFNKYPELEIFPKHLINNQ